MEIKSLDTEFLRDLTIPSLKSLHSRESYLSTLKLSSYVASLKTDTQNLRNNDIKVQWVRTPTAEESVLMLSLGARMLFEAHYLPVSVCQSPH